jgi:hypothetical protein
MLKGFFFGSDAVREKDDCSLYSLHRPNRVGAWENQGKQCCHLAWNRPERSVVGQCCCPERSLIGQYCHPSSRQRTCARAPCKP